MKAKIIEEPEPKEAYGGAVRTYVYTCFWGANGEKESDTVNQEFDPHGPGRDGIAAFARWVFWSCINGEWVAVDQHAPRSYWWGNNKWNDGSEEGVLSKPSRLY
jgi:hypothetical protein